MRVSAGGLNRDWPGAIPGLRHGNEARGAAEAMTAATDKKILQLDDDALDQSLGRGSLFSESLARVPGAVLLE